MVHDCAIQLLKFFQKCCFMLIYLPKSSYDSSPDSCQWAAGNTWPDRYPQVVELTLSFEPLENLGFAQLSNTIIQRFNFSLIKAPAIGDADGAHVFRQVFRPYFLDGR